MSTNEKTHWRVVTPATWPAPPAEMSVSTYAEIEECPRRWALSSAEYPELWGGRGYPPKLQVAALAGIKTHTSVFPLREANEVLSKLRAGRITGAAVLQP